MRERVECSVGSAVVVWCRLATPPLRCSVGAHGCAARRQRCARLHCYSVVLAYYPPPRRHQRPAPGAAPDTLRQNINLITLSTGKTCSTSTFVHKDELARKLHALTALSERRAHKSQVWSPAANLFETIFTVSACHLCDAWQQHNAS